MLRPYDLSRYSLDDYFAEDKKRFSAAAVAIRYMKCLRPEAGKKIGWIVLDEDDACIAWPECHTQGLVPFCQEYEHLRIDRHINIWKTMFKTSWNVMATTSNQYIDPWLMEAVGLLDLDMPQRAFRLTFIGDMSLSRATQTFNVALKDATWQAALEKCTSVNQYGQLDPAITRISPAFIMAGFPQAMPDIASGISIVRCDSPIGPMPREEEVPRRHFHWSLNKWERK